MSFKKIPLFKVAMSPDAKKLVGDVLDSGYIGQGPKVEDFEDFLQEKLKLKTRPLTVNSCTSALMVALKMLPIEPGDIVVSTPQTCTATNHAILQCAARILWADIDPVTGLIDPISVAKLYGEYGDRIKAVVAVDWGGGTCDYKTLRRAAPGIPIIQDAAHCLEIDVENCGDLVAWSFGPIKHLTCVDGGLLYINPDGCDAPQAIREKGELIRWFGIDRKTGDSFRCANLINLPGGKYHMNDVNATVGMANFSLALSNVRKGQANATAYRKELAGLPLSLPVDSKNHQYWIFTICVDASLRDRLMNFLTENGIASSQVHARNDLHPVFKDPKYCVNPQLDEKELSGTYAFSSRQLSIPIGWWVTEEDRKYIVQKIKEFFDNV